MCAYSLDHITPSRLGIIVVANINDISNVRDLKDPRLSLFDTFVEFISNALHPKFSKNTAPASAPGRFKSLCALSTFRVVGLGGLEPPASPLSGVRSNHLSYRPNVSSLLILVEPVGIEPTTPCLQSRCSPS